MERVKVPVSHFMNNGTYIKPLAVCFVGKQRPRGMSRLPLYKMPWLHSTTLHSTPQHCTLLSATNSASTSCSKQTMTALFSLKAEFVGKGRL